MLEASGNAPTTVYTNEEVTNFFDIIMLWPANARN